MSRVAHIVGKGFDDAFFWYPIAPAGYAALGCIVSKKDEAPRIDSVCCPRLDLVNPGNILEMPISRSSSSKGSHCWSIWKVENQASVRLSIISQKKILVTNYIFAIFFNVAVIVIELLPIYKHVLRILSTMQILVLL